VLGIINREFPGTIKEKDDPKNRGRYLVHIPELMYTIFDHPDQDGIFCANHTHKWRDTNIINEGATERGGSYHPLNIGTRVIVKFFSEDYSSGYIDRVISDYHPIDEDNDVSCMPEESEGVTNPRDNYYQVVRSKKKDIIAIRTDDEHKFWIHYYKDNEKWVTIELDDEGLTIRSEKDIDILAKENTVIKTDEKNITVNAAKILTLTAGEEIMCDGCNALQYTIEKHEKEYHSGDGETLSSDNGDVV
jgi:hypothetical protein